MADEPSLLAIGARINDLADFTDIVIAGTTSALISPIIEASENNTGISDGVLISLLNRIDELLKVEASLQEKVSALLEEQQRQQNDFREEILDSWENITVKKLRDIRTAEEETERKIELGIVAAQELIQEKEDSLSKGILDTLGVAVGGLVDAVVSTESKTSLLLGLDLAKLTDTLAPILTKTQSIVQTLREVLPDAIDALPGAFGTALGGALQGSFGPILSMLDLFSVEKWQEALDQVHEVYKVLEDDPFMGSFIRIITPGGQIVMGAIAIAATTAIVMSLVTSAASSAFSGWLEKSRQWSWKRARPGMLGPVELRELINRRMIQPEDAIEHLKNQGFKDDDIVRLLDLRQQLLNLGEVVSLWRREEITDTEFEIRLEALGFQGSDQEHIRTLAFAIPSVRDVILFGVREVFDLDFAIEFGQLEGADDRQIALLRTRLGQFGGGIEGSVKAMVHFAKQSGLSEEWALAYWASHWRLPSVTSLFDMVHRLAPDIVEANAEDFKAIGINPDNLAFTVSDLQRQLRAQDYTPAFRERLTALSFKPLTRVDVRRMHRLGLIDDAGLVVRYRMLGFAPADARLMAKFTIDYNFRPTANEAKEIGDLTRTQILTFFENGYLERGDAVGALVEAGFGPNVAETFVALRELDILEDTQKQQLRGIRERFNARLMNFNDAVVALDALLIPAQQRDAIIADMEATIAGRVRMPTPSQLDNLLKENIITRPIYIQTMIDLDFERVWADRLANLNSIDPSEGS